MSHKIQSRGPQGLSVNTTEQLFEYLDRFEAKLNLIVWKIDYLYRQNKSIINMENIQMADFTALNAKVAKIADLATAVKTAYDGAIVERDAFKAERDALLAADSTDQAAVDAAEASLAAAEAVIASLTAVAEGTPVELPPDTGSTGGVTGSTGNV